jgi:hypothetical protein
MIWVTSRQARELGCTHHALYMGLIPGFFREKDALWVPRSDLLYPFEWAVTWIWQAMRAMRGEDGDFMFDIGKEIGK